IRRQHVGLASQNVIYHLILGGRRLCLAQRLYAGELVLLIQYAGDAVREAAVDYTVEDNFHNGLLAFDALVASFQIQDLSYQLTFCWINGGGDAVLRVLRLLSSSSLRMERTLASASNQAS